MDNNQELINILQNILGILQRTNATHATHATIDPMLNVFERQTYPETTANINAATADYDKYQTVQELNEFMIRDLLPQIVIQLNIIYGEINQYILKVMNLEMSDIIDDIFKNKTSKNYQLIKDLIRNTPIATLIEDFNKTFTGAFIKHDLLSENYNDYVYNMTMLKNCPDNTCNKTAPFMHDILLITYDYNLFNLFTYYIGLKTIYNIPTKTEVSYINFIYLLDFYGFDKYVTSSVAYASGSSTAGHGLSLTSYIFDCRNVFVEFIKTHIATRDPENKREIVNAILFDIIRKTLLNKSFTMLGLPPSPILPLPTLIGQTQNSNILDILKNINTNKITYDFLILETYLKFVKKLEIVVSYINQVIIRGLQTNTTTLEDNMVAYNTNMTYYFYAKYLIVNKIILAVYENYIALFNIKYNNYKYMLFLNLSDVNNTNISEHNALFTTAFNTANGSMVMYNYLNNINNSGTDAFSKNIKLNWFKDFNSPLVAYNLGTNNLANIQDRATPKIYNYGALYEKTYVSLNTYIKNFLQPNVEQNKQYRLANLLKRYKFICELAPILPSDDGYVDNNSIKNPNIAVLTQSFIKGITELVKIPNINAYVNEQKLMGLTMNAGVFSKYMFIFNDMYLPILLSSSASSMRPPTTYCSSEIDSNLIHNILLCMLYLKKDTDTFNQVEYDLISHYLSEKVLNQYAVQTDLKEYIVQIVLNLTKNIKKSNILFNYRKNSKEPDIDVYKKLTNIFYSTYVLLPQNITLDYKMPYNEIINLYVQYSTTLKYDLARMYLIYKLIFSAVACYLPVFIFGMNDFITTSSVTSPQVQLQPQNQIHRINEKLFLKFYFTNLNSLKAIDIQENTTNTDAVSITSSVASTIVGQSTINVNDYEKMLKSLHNNLTPKLINSKGYFNNNSEELTIFERLIKVFTNNAFVINAARLMEDARYENIDTNLTTSVQTNATTDAAAATRRVPQRPREIINNNLSSHDLINISNRNYNTIAADIIAQIDNQHVFLTGDDFHTYNILNFIFIFIKYLFNFSKQYYKKNIQYTFNPLDNNIITIFTIIQTHYEGLIDINAEEMGEGRAAAAAANDLDITYFDKFLLALHKNIQLPNLSITENLNRSLNERNGTITNENKTNMFNFIYFLHVIYSNIFVYNNYDYYIANCEVNLFNIKYTNEQNFLNNYVHIARGQTSDINDVYSTFISYALNYKTNLQYNYEDDIYYTFDKYFKYMLSHKYIEIIKPATPTTLEYSFNIFTLCDALRTLIRRGDFKKLLSTMYCQVNLLAPDNNNEIPCVLSTQSPDDYNNVIDNISKRIIADNMLNSILNKYFIKDMTNTTSYENVNTLIKYNVVLNMFFYIITQDTKNQLIATFSSGNDLPDYYDLFEYYISNSRSFIATILYPYTWPPLVPQASNTLNVPQATSETLNVYFVNNLLGQNLVSRVINRQTRTTKMTKGIALNNIALMFKNSYFNYNYNNFKLSSVMEQADYTKNILQIFEKLMNGQIVFSRVGNVRSMQQFGGAPVVKENGIKSVLKALYHIEGGSVLKKLTRKHRGGGRRLRCYSLRHKKHGKQYCVQK